MGYRLYVLDQNKNNLECLGKLFSYRDCDAFTCVKYLIEIGKMTTYQYKYDAGDGYSYELWWELGISGPEFELTGEQLKQFLVYYKNDWDTAWEKPKDSLGNTETDWSHLNKLLSEIDENKTYWIDWR